MTALVCAAEKETQAFIFSMLTCQSEAPLKLQFAESPTTSVNQNFLPDIGALVKGLTLSRSFQRTVP